VFLELKKSALCSNDPILARSCFCRAAFSLPYTGFWFIHCGPCGGPLLVHILILLVRSFSVGSAHDANIIIFSPSFSRGNGHLLYKLIAQLIKKTNNNALLRREYNLLQMESYDLVNLKLVLLAE
jgi:hypothetical protein